MLSACGADTPPPRASAPPIALPSPRPAQPAGTDRVIGKAGPALVTLFGRPDLDVREGPGRKLQFRSAVCVLDAYLYPPAPGQEPLVRHLDARGPGGEDIDTASCIAGLTRRAQAR